MIKFYIVDDCFDGSRNVFIVNTFKEDLSVEVKEWLEFYNIPIPSVYYVSSVYNKTRGISVGSYTFSMPDDLATLFILQFNPIGKITYE